MTSMTNQQLIESLAASQILIEGVVLICLSVGLLAVYLELVGRHSNNLTGEEAENEITY